MRNRTTPWAFYRLFVVPNYSDFADWNPGSVRHGFNASVAAFHLSDIVLEYYAREDPAKIANWPTRKRLLLYLQAEEPQFLTVQSVATVYKHFSSPHAHVEVASPADVIEAYLPKFDLLSDTDLGSGKSYVSVKRKGAMSAVSLNDALRAVLDLWERTLPPDGEEY